MDVMGLTKSWKLVVFLLGLTLFYNEVEGGMSSISKQEDLELERQLKILNKPPIKTVQGDAGDVFDCINIHKQAAFDNPLLKNHKIQMSPSSHPRGLIQKTSQVDKYSMVRQKLIDCPKGTVPIRRTSKEDLKRAKSLDAHSLASLLPGHHRANVRTKETTEVTYFGVQGYINAYNPKVEANQRSLALMWAENGPIDQLNSIQAGWQVSPELFGDDRTRLFVYWRVDGNNKTTGCFNLFCPGFVQIDPNNPVGDFLSPTSTYGGTQYAIPLSIFQDKVTGNWWLTLIDQSVKYGYWPRSLFTHLGAGASVVSWGGLAIGPTNGPSPPMGSGHFPDRYYDHACYFRNIKVIIGSNNSFVYPYMPFLEDKVDASNCYDVLNVGFKDQRNGHVIKFGGPGGFC